MNIDPVMVGIVLLNLWIIYTVYRFFKRKKDDENEFIKLKRPKE